MGQRLRALREAAGLNQQQLDQQAELASEEISRLEHGRRVASVSSVHKLSQALGVPPKCIVDNTPIGLEMLAIQEVGRRLDIPLDRIQVWLKTNLLPGMTSWRGVARSRHCRDRTRA